MFQRLALCRAILLQTSVLLPAQVVRVGSLKPKPNVINGDTLTLTATPSAVSFQLISKGIAVGSTPVTITTTWSGLSLLSSVAVYASFLDATSALSGGTPVSKIPSSCVLGRDPTGNPTTFTSFMQSNPLGGSGAGLTLYSSSGVLGLVSNHIDTLSLEINLTTLPQLPAGTYTGILTLQAQAF